MNDALRGCHTCRVSSCRTWANNVLDMHVHVVHIRAVKLNDYMEKQDLSDEELGALIGKERSLVGRYRRGKVTPPPEVIERIERATNFEVCLRDWVGDAALQKVS